MCYLGSDKVIGLSAKSVPLDHLENKYFGAISQQGIQRLIFFYFLESIYIYIHIHCHSKVWDQ